MDNMIPLVKPILVKPLLPEEQEALQRHGCTITPFPENHPKLLKGHMVTFHDGTHMEDSGGIQYSVHSPDGYTATLIWSENWYHLYPERSESGPLL